MTPSTKTVPAITSLINSDPFNALHFFDALSISLNTIVRQARRLPLPLVFAVRSRTVAKVDSIGLLVDFTRLKQIVREIMGRLDHQFVNDLEPFKTVNPSAENMAKYFYEEVARGLDDLPPGARITEVVLWETDTSRAQYRPGN